MTIFTSDLYRLRKGAAIRNTLIGLLITIVFLACTFFTVGSDGFQVFLDDTAASQGASNSEIAQMQADMDEFDVFMPRSAADFAREIVATNMLPFFFLPLIITIFCADFGNGTYRNTLSYETNRTKVYLSKLILSVCGCVFLTLVSLLLSILIGGIAFGFGGLTPAFFLQILVSTLLLLPIQLAIIGFGHCLVAFTKKSSMTIAIYLIALMLLTSLIQMLTMIPSLQWLSLLDWNMVGKLMISYWTLPFSDILIAVVSGLAIAAGTTVLGVTHYRKADMA